MLQLAHRTCAPSATSVSISTAVCTVMCSEPVMRVPRSGCVLAYSARTAIRPGISCSARVISLRPNSASERSATLNGIGSAGICAPVWNGLRFVIMGIWWSEQPISHDHYSWPGHVSTGNSPTVGHERPAPHATRAVLDTKMLDLAHAHHRSGSAARYVTPDAPVPGHARPAS